MSRKSKAKEKAQQEQAQDPDSAPEVFGGEQEHTVGKDDAPIIITRSDPNFEAREKLNEALWQREKSEFHVAFEPPKAEGEEEKPEPEEAQEPEQAAEEAEPEEPQEEEEKTEEAEEEAPEEEEEYETLKVYGETIRRPKKEVEENGGVAQYQKKLAAEKQLEEASKERKEIYRMLEEFKTVMAGAQLPKGAVEVTKPQRVPTESEKQHINNVIEKLQYGDENERVEAYYELSQGRKNATPEQTEEIANGVLRVLQERQQKAEQEWIERKREEIYNSIAKPKEEGGCLDILPPEMGGTCEDPGIYAYFSAKVWELTGAGKPQEPATYIEAAELARKTFGLSPKDSQRSLSEKRQQKREIDVVKGVKAKTPATPKDQEDTHESILNEHRKFRGLIRKEI